MRFKEMSLWVVGAVVLLAVYTGHGTAAGEGKRLPSCLIVTSDTILSGMAAQLLPPSRYTVKALLPPDQCPGHYDVKLSDIEMLKRAELVVSFRGMPFPAPGGPGGRGAVLLDTGGRNWMAPEAYISGLERLATELSGRFPRDRDEIMRRKGEAVRLVAGEAAALAERVRRAGLAGKPVLGSAMQREPLAWMGLHVVAAYGRPEAMSARDFVRLAKIGRERRAIAVVDNLQSGPETGKALAAALGAAHVVLTNFPSDRGYRATLTANVEAVVTALKGR